MGTLQTIENKMADAFKGVPPLPDSAKELLANVWPWLALVGGVLQLLAALALYHLANFATRLWSTADWVAYYGGLKGPSRFDKTVIYFGVLMLAVDAVILLLAFPKLQKREKGGWNLLFLGGLVNLAYGVIQIFTYQRGIFSFVWSLLSSAVAFYLLFQVREKFGGSKLSKTAASPLGPTKVK